MEKEAAEEEEEEEEEEAALSLLPPAAVGKLSLSNTFACFFLPSSSCM